MASPVSSRPANWSALSEFALLPLRLFLGGVFIFAGFQKLANPNFFNPKSPISIQQSLLASERVSPIHAFLTPLNHIGKPLGLFIAYAELAIGLGVFAGLWTRIAAIGGLLLSLNLWLTVSFHASPWFTSADIVYMFAWVPFIIAGSGSRFSLDGWLVRSSARKAKVATSEFVAVPFSHIVATCGNYNAGKCQAMSGALCGEDLCPILRGGVVPTATKVEIAGLSRRQLVAGATAAGGALILGGLVADTGRLVGNAPAPQSNALGGGSTSPTVATTTTTTMPSSSSSTTTPATTTSGPKPKGTLLGKASVVPVGQAAAFTIASTGNPGVVVHTSKGWFAYNAVCPHAGCQVQQYSAANNALICPCHGSVFNATTGAVESGPSPRGLTKLTVVEGSDGNLYLQ